MGRFRQQVGATHPSTAPASVALSDGTPLQTVTFSWVAYISRILASCRGAGLLIWCAPRGTTAKGREGVQAGCQAFGLHH